MSHLIDLFILAAEPSGDLHGQKLIASLLKQNPSLKIGAVAGPQMRALPIECYYPMENLQVMGFIDVFASLPKLLKQFFLIRKKILQLNPKAVICIDYPGFNLRLEKSLKKKGFKGKLIHYICPTVWAWGKKRIETMEKTLDLLLTFFPFEKKCFSQTFPVRYIGHPLTNGIDSIQAPRKKILALFPGSREKEIMRNYPLQMEAAQQLLKENPDFEVVVSSANEQREMQLKKLTSFPVRFVSTKKNYELMRTCHLAIAKSGTVTLELALHQTPTVVTYAIDPLDVWLAQNLFKIDLPFYCIVNIIGSKEIFPELFGPRLTRESLFREVKKLSSDPEARELCMQGCIEVAKLLGNKAASQEAAKEILKLIYSTQ